MKSKLPLSCRCPMAVWGLVLGVVLATWGTASAQNLVRNPDFELPLGPDNWTVVYTNVINSTSPNAPTGCGPLDFMIAGRTTMAHKDVVPGTWDGEDRTGTNYWSKFGGHFAPNHDWMMHAYFRQVISNLTPNATYNCSAWMAFWGGDYLTRCSVYLEAIGGPNGLISHTVPTYPGNVLNLNPAEGGGPEAWQKYAVTQTATPSGRMEIRLHLNCYAGQAQYWGWRNYNAFYDHVAVMPVNASTNPPPYRILSFTRTNQDIALTWQAVMNDRYHIAVSTDLSTNQASWKWVKWSPKLDTNLVATAPIFTFQTNLTSLFAYDPSFDPNAPLFFRIHCTRFQP